MAKKDEFTEHRWGMREVLAPGTPVGALACTLGYIHIGGPMLFRIPPGGWEVQGRPFPAGVGFPVAVAMEPRTPHRIAVAPDSGDVVIFTDTVTGHSISGHPFTDTPGALRAKQLCWVVNDGMSSLFALAEDGRLFRMQTEGWGELDLPPVRAIASDDTGGFAALTVVDGEPKVYVSQEGGTHYQLRPLGLRVEVEPDAPASLALAGEAVAAVVGDAGPLVSRAWGQKIWHHACMDRAQTLAFEGSASNARLYTSLRHTEDDPAAIWYLPDDAAPQRVMDFLCEDMEPLDIGPLVWDPARRALMISSRAGLLAMEALKPRAKRAKKPKVQ